MEGQFVRASPERSSNRSHLSSYSSPAGSVGGSVGSAPSVTLQTARHRAVQAAEYYHRQVLGERERALSDSGSHSNYEDLYPPAEPPPPPAPPAHGVETGGRGEPRLPPPPHEPAPDTPPRDPREPPRPGATPNSDYAGYYKQKLRTGFIDLRNSYNEKLRPKMLTYRTHPMSDGERAGLGRLDEGLPGLPAPNGTVARSRIPLSDRRGLYRSNSSLELDHERIQYIDEDRTRPHPLKRDYGSANSIDAISQTTGESFFALLRDYRGDNPDQRAPAPPQMQEVLRGRLNYNKHPNWSPNINDFRAAPAPLSSNTKVYNGSVPVDNSVVANTMGSQDHIDGVTSSPKLKSKSQKNKDRKPRNKSMISESTGGIFRKLRGTKSGDPGDPGSKSPESSSEGDNIRMEDRQKRKAFVHYDCQSIGFNLQDMIRKRSQSGDNSALQKNVTTGASAASGVRTQGGSTVDITVPDEPDQGDGKTNDLLQSCPFFRNEVGGEEERVVVLNRNSAQKRVQQLLGNRLSETQMLMRNPACNGVAILDNSPNPHGISEPSFVTYKGYVIEHIDHGALYYRNFFHTFDHQDFFGIDENLGPVAVSFKREKVDDKERETSTGKNQGAGNSYQYRIIFRASQLETLRGSILEDVIPSSSRLSMTRGLPPKEVLEYCLPDFNWSCLRQAQVAPKTAEQLMKLDEQGMSRKYKIGVMFCRAGQSTEEDMYNNEFASPAFDEFIELIGQRVRLKGFENYRGGLDCKTDSTGTHSLYAELNNNEIMFHVATMLPYTPNNKQQLLRKRHIGNDIVTIVFQEPGAKSFTPQSIRSHFQHVFIIVRVHSPNTDHVKYSLAISRSKDVPPFGPAIPDGALFCKSADFAEFLLVKAINAENAVHSSDKFTAMARRTREEYLKDLANNFVTANSLESGSKLSKFSLGSGRKKDKQKVHTIPDYFAKGATIWNVQLEDFGQSSIVEGHLGIASETVVVIEEPNNEVVFAIPCRSVIGWSAQSCCLRLYFDHGECIVLKTSELPNELQEIVTRLEHVTQGIETTELSLRRNGLGQLGFHVHYEGIVSDVEPHGFAWQSGLRQGSRLVEICKVSVATLTHEQMIDLLRTSVVVKVIVVPPHEDGSPRMGCEDLLSSRSSLDSHHTSASDHTVTHDDDPQTHSAARSQSYHKMRPETHDTPPRRVASTSNYTDLRMLNSPSDSSSRYPVSHGKQASHDSAGSRSSGRGSDGHGSSEGHAGHAARTDNVSSEGFVSGEERAPRGMKEMDRTSGTGWTGVTIYPAYNKDAYHQGNSQSSPSPAADGRNMWHEQPGYPSAGYPSNRDSERNRKALGGASLSVPNYMNCMNRDRQERDPRDPNRDWDQGRGEYRDQEWENYAESTPATRGREPEEQRPPAQLPSSMSNLSQHSDMSNHSAGSARGHSPGYKLRPEDYQSREERLSNQRLNSISPVGRSKKASYSNHRRRNLDGSPHGSNASSPRSSNRNLAGGPSEENLSSSTRRKVPATPGKNHTTTSNNFQQDLMRLIDPDVSFTESEPSPAKDASYSTSSGSGGRSRRPYSRSPRLHRTLSDESMCGRGKHRSSKAPPAVESLGHDVIFTTVTAVPAHVTPKRRNKEDLTREQKLSPRALTDVPQGSMRPPQAPPPHSPGTSPVVPLPEPASDLNWNNLVETAKKAFEGSQPDVRQDPSDGRDKAGKQAGKHSKPKVITPPKSSHRQHPEAARTHTENMTWNGSPEGNTAVQRIQELEVAVTQLDNELEKERQEKAALEIEVHQLREDNVRLSHESQTAATQLRKFTEWFFNTIDRT